jgi:hypothetical protein
MNSSTSTTRPAGTSDATSRDMTNTHCPMGLCDGSGIIVNAQEGTVATCDCPTGVDLAASIINDIFRPISNDVFEDMEEAEAFEALSTSEQLRLRGAPPIAYLDLSDAACCADGLCKECESVI